MAKLWLVGNKEMQTDLKEFVKIMVIRRFNEDLLSLEVISESLLKIFINTRILKFELRTISEDLLKTISIIPDSLKKLKITISFYNNDQIISNIYKLPQKIETFNISGAILKFNCSEIDNYKNLKTLYVNLFSYFNLNVDI